MSEKKYPVFTIYSPKLITQWFVTPLAAKFSLVLNFEAFKRPLQKKNIKRTKEAQKKLAHDLGEKSLFI